MSTHITSAKHPHNCQNTHTYTHPHTTKPTYTRTHTLLNKFKKTHSSEYAPNDPRSLQYSQYRTVLPNSSLYSVALQLSTKKNYENFHLNFVCQFGITFAPKFRFDIKHKLI